MRRYFVIACLAILLIATIAAAASQLTRTVQVTNPPEINGVTPTATSAPTQVPTQVPTPVGVSSLSS